MSLRRKSIFLILFFLGGLTFKNRIFSIEQFLLEQRFMGLRDFIKLCSMVMSYLTERSLRDLRGFMRHDSESIFHL